MTWEEKLATCQEITGHHLCMRKPGDWYVSCSVNYKNDVNDCMLRGIYGNGDSPEAAVENHWQKLTGLPEIAFLVTNIGGERRCWRWKNSHWSIVDAIVPC